MDITLKKTGRTFYKIDPTLAAILCELNLADKFERPAPIPTPTTWGVGIFPYSGRRHIRVCCDGGREIYQFIGAPAQIHAFETSLPASAGKCPESVRAQYAAEYVPYDPADA